MRPESPIGEPFFELSEVDSSNNYAMQQVQEQMAGHGATYFANYQSAGKGQRGKPWNAEPKMNLMMSSVIEPANLAIDNQFLLNIAVTLACVDFFAKYTNGDTYIKWPNDIYWKDRKAGGILIENVLKGRDWRFSIVGIGININQTLFPGHLPNPVSLKQITGKNFDVIALAKDLCHHLESGWQQCLNKVNHESLLQEYCSRLYKLNQLVTFKTGESTFSATVIGADRQGKLLIDTGQISAVDLGAVSWVLPS